jgi:hypothetical protein
LPPIREEFREPVGGVGAAALEDVPDIREGIHVEALTRGDHAGAVGVRVAAIPTTAFP